MIFSLRYFLFASRDVRGSGVGGTLLERIAELAAERGAKYLYICAANSQNTVDFCDPTDVPGSLSLSLSLSLFSFHV